MVVKPDTPHCRQCRHYYITWDPTYPYGCRKMGFKSTKAPWDEVIDISGQTCQVFEPKPKRPNE
ncbi:MAG: hypothetical protein A2527_11555 [Candidatus Lambdaproteobacteria bacterium RIFOXYD2_FULL_50_16]|uniref:Uracil-DNA glycosylase n=1 Tax=Candidatus Lambdaproteobacteria bacterium RIFOXYD2_FULL_50_16 TaxID=1817772 RepID=A0A1F6G602_9PROT|nr:MAG: hypothetical protein A2527_11555 [Candidatus Lambdaproteobacteria bacterium RIFOXYD2_FULL_50_16]